MLRPISTSLSPNTERDDIKLTFKLLFQPWLWKKNQIGTRFLTGELEEEFKKYFKVDFAVSFNSGRSAFLAILDALDIKKGNEVLLQAFTCNSVVNPILNRGATPIFVDINETLNLDSKDLKKKITEKSKAVIVQHTFGWPANLDEILKICRENNLILIEDCAHSLGAEYKGKKIGTFGEAAFFSFGRDKVISSVFGGMAVTNNYKIGKRLRGFQEKLNFPSNFWIFQQLLHPILINYLILPAYGVNQYLGKIILGLFHKFSILSKAVYKKEKIGEIPKYFPKKLPNILSLLVLNQFKKLEKYNQHRRKISQIYQENLRDKFNLPLVKKDENILSVFMRFPILVKNNTDGILKEARKRKIYLNDGWRKSPVVPPDTDLKKMRYILGSCPKAEETANKIINLPTDINISQKQSERIINFFKKYGN